MSDYLENKVRETEARLAEASQQLVILQAELRAYKDALAHSRPTATGAVEKPITATRVAQPAPPPPRKPAPSKPNAQAYWKDLVADIATQANHAFTIDDVVGALKKRGKGLERKSVRAKLVDLVKANYVIRVQDGVFKLAPPGLSGDDLRAAGIIPPHARLVGEDAA
jgi:hypothetical protein